MDEVFRALADPSRRQLLDRLRLSSGQTLGQLCQGLAMSRQAVSKHLAVLESASLVVWQRRGREKLHHLNPVPIQEIYDRWIGKFERDRLSALSDLKRALEEEWMADETFLYVIFIESSPEKVWQALTDGSFTRQYWAGRRLESDWREGATVRLYLEDSDDFELEGKVLEFEPMRRLSYTWQATDAGAAKASTVTFELHPMGESVRLTITHGPLAADDMARQGWSAILSSLKSYLETGKALSATEMWRKRAA